MTESASWRDELERSVGDDVSIIVEAFARQGIDIAVVTAGDGGLGYMFARGQVLVRDQHLTRVLEILEQPPERELRDNEPDRLQRITPGVQLVTLGPTPSGVQHAVPDAVNLVDRELGLGVATPNHVLTVCPTSGGCPATEPEPAYAGIEPYPSVCHGNGGEGVLVYMADTGLLANPAHGHPWLKGVREGDAGDLDPGNGQDPIPPYTAHGTFVAGVARCVAPAAEVIVTNAFAIAGSTLESDLVPRLVGALGLGVDIFHLTIAAPTRADLPLIAFEAWLKLLRQYKGVVVVVAAGNSGSRRPSWPAAFSEVVSVGALAADWRSRASFSNHGGWVDVYAPGRDLINAYTSGTYVCHVEPYTGQQRQFYGMAKWSGTSFSTPIVTGLIASRMSRTGENGQQAAAALLAEAREQAIPGVGPILLPCCHDRHRAGPHECGCGPHRPAPGC
ncbi:MAG TPA: S8/S53 family peptidase [Streptosporangiaceae bacterium]